jgi:hypothetical protein
MAVTELHKLISSRFDEQAKKLDRTDEKVDKMASESSRQFAEFTKVIHEHDKVLDRHELLISSNEDRVSRIDSDVSDMADNTGRHEVAGLQTRLDEALAARHQLEDGKTHWVRWVITTIAGIVIAILAALLGAKFGG